mmetsp:Transcript_24141/g.69684  ORF Transcript_24141/g.69684 Transcript_24141/m.69684 type:complete len:328 (+) Transcript_24141:59-1042(+)|eukprot:CAMPEP_0168452876 /NCGR_PEP_ID=MMETSP0228-20121227/49390_1 /TAXON_ID=133427 /ORGANISM="Protoceratium reticulatum, Strain CCCM 535 (=CCMP 1889)" /LENGTH=327 /DNA_ID=CAMNT_0008467563 /DNA_START=42 /DNA_END=1025 /DNA_ORIENTATION=+
MCNPVTVAMFIGRLLKSLLPLSANCLATLVPEEEAGGCEVVAATDVSPERAGGCKRVPFSRPREGRQEGHDLLILPAEVLAGLFELLAAQLQSLLPLASVSSQTADVWFACLTDHAWQGLYAKRWPAFYDHFADMVAGHRYWRSLYLRTLAGRVECPLEVYNRELKRGYTLSAMPAQVHYDALQDAYIVRYQSAADPERVPSSEARRLRWPVAAGAPGREAQVCPIDHLVPGEAVEFQWKMQAKSSFAWWYAEVETFERTSASTATASLLFVQFHEASRWYRVRVYLGLEVEQPKPLGGTVGGLRRLSQAEKQHWLQFLPSTPFNPR